MQGLGVSSRDAIFAAIIVNRIMYALPVFFGYLSEKDKSQIMSIFVKARRWQLLLFPLILKPLLLMLSIIFFNNHSPAVTVYITFTLLKLKTQMQWSCANEDTILYSPLLITIKSHFHSPGPIQLPLTRYSLLFYMFIFSLFITLSNFRL